MTFGESAIIDVKHSSRIGRQRLVDSFYAKPIIVGSSRKASGTVLSAEVTLLQFADGLHLITKIETSRCHKTSIMVNDEAELRWL